VSPRTIDVVTPDLLSALRRTRRVTRFYAAAWIASPAMLIALVLAAELFPWLRLASTEGPQAVVVVLLVLALAGVAVARPVAASAHFQLARSCGEPAAHPIVGALITFLFPWLPNALSTRVAVQGLQRVDKRLELSTATWTVLFLGPLLELPGLVLFGISGALDEGQARDPPYSVYVLAFLFAVYGGTRAFAALRLCGLIDDLLLRPAVDDLRASHSAPVGGG
jgi:hypothetical protein